MSYNRQNGILACSSFRWFFYRNLKMWGRIFEAMLCNFVWEWYVYLVRRCSLFIQFSQNIWYDTCLIYHFCEWWLLLPGEAPLTGLGSDCMQGVGSRPDRQLSSSSVEIIFVYLLLFLFLGTSWMGSSWTLNDITFGGIASWPAAFLIFCWDHFF